MLWLDSDSYFTGYLVSQSDWPQEFGLLYYGMLLDATAMKWKLSKLLATYDKSHNKALKAYRRKTCTHLQHLQPGFSKVC